MVWWWKVKLGQTQPQTLLSFSLSGLPKPVYNFPAQNLQSGWQVSSSWLRPSTGCELPLRLPSHQSSSSGFFEVFCQLRLYNHTGNCNIDWIEKWKEWIGPNSRYRKATVTSLYWSILLQIRKSERTSYNTSTKLNILSILIDSPSYAIVPVSYTHLTLPTISDV